MKTFNVETFDLKETEVYHGHVFSPASRAYFAWEEGKLDYGAMNQREAGKFFPKTEAGLTDLFAPSDTPNHAPPEDGKIASAGQDTGKYLDNTGTHWKKHDVKSLEELTVNWGYSQVHRTRRWNYFITKKDWDPNQVLSREQFEETPFYTVQNNQQPYWDFTEELTPPNPTVHQVKLPKRTGYHVLLAVWEVADTGNAFYHVIDLNFTNNEGEGERPGTPENFEAIEIKARSVTLSWNSPQESESINKYRIIRNGMALIEVDGSVLSCIDTGVLASSQYTYFISAVDYDGKESLPSPTIVVCTLGEDGSEVPPPPVNLHHMGVTENSIELMWGKPLGNHTITFYHIYRDGKKLTRISSGETRYTDKNLQSNTNYHYYVISENSEELTSSPSNDIYVKTSESGGDYPEWAFNTRYEENDKVTYKGKHYICLQAHISYESAGWYPDAPGVVGIIWNLI